MTRARLGRGVPHRAVVVRAPAEAGGLSLALTGSAATSSAGTNLVGVALALAGSVGTSSAGTLAPSVTIALTGTQAAASAGTITYSAADVTVALSGQSATSAAGTLSPSSTVSLAGEAAAASAGTLTATGGAALAAVGGGAPIRRKREYDFLNVPTRAEITALEQAQAKALVALPKPAQKAVKSAVRRAADLPAPQVHEVVQEVVSRVKVPGAAVAFDAALKLHNALRHIEWARQQAADKHLAQAEAQRLVEVRQAEESSKALAAQYQRLLDDDAAAIKFVESINQQAVKALQKAVTGLAKMYE